MSGLRGEGGAWSVNVPLINAINISGETFRIDQRQVCLLGFSGHSDEPLYSPKKSHPAWQLVLMAELGTHKVNDVLLQACKSVEKSSTKVFRLFSCPRSRTSTQTIAYKENTTVGIN